VSGQRHNYWACHDKNCQRLACLAFKEGYALGYSEGVADAAAGS
jgi:hypothetical protein